MELKDITRALVDEHGYSQNGLARELKARGVKCSQPAIWRILQGSATTDTVGHAIRELYREKTKGSAAA